MSLGLVLGAGGTVGLAYHAGVLRALEQEAGVVPDDADLMVGTSAGSVVAAYLRSGWTTAQLWDLVLASGDLPPSTESALEQAGLPPLFVAAFGTPFEAVRRGVGSAYVLSRMLVRAPVPALPGPIRRAFPGGMFFMTEGRRRFTEELPGEWPAKPTWLCAVDIVSGRRIVLGRRGTPSIGLQQSMMASCAIPGLYPPVRYGRRELIDGGAHSTTNLDLAGTFGCDLVIGVVPMGYDDADPPWLPLRAARRIANRSLAAEAAAVRRRGAEVLLIRPGRREAAIHGLNMMRSYNLLGVARAAYEATARAVATEPFRRALGERAA